VSLAVASVPEGLPLLATATQLSAAGRLAERHALVRNVRSIEALGRVDVICFDKTGTVTEGRIEVGVLSDGREREEFAPESAPPSLWASEVLTTAFRAAASELVDARDPTELSLGHAAIRLENAQEPFEFTKGERLDDMPLRTGRFFVAVLWRDSDGLRTVSVKGASEHVVPLCSHYRRAGAVHELTDEVRFSLAAEAARLASLGLRVLAVAERRVDVSFELDDLSLMDLEFVGFIGLRDPVRPTAERTMTRLKRAGIRPVLITGDHPGTGGAVAAALGLPFAENIVTGASLAQLDDDELDQCINTTGVFARVTPAQKVRIVRSLSRSGRVVAMVGDGANDAPAIRLADVGVAIGEHSTPAARRAADVVLTDGRIETLVDAIAEGRAMWASVKDSVSILLGGNLGEIGFSSIAGLLDGRPPLNARQLLLVNLMTDVAPAMAFALRTPSAARLEALVDSPQEVEEAMSAGLNREIVARAVTTALGAGGAWTFARFTGGHARARTIGLAALVGTQLGQTLVSGGFSRPVLVTGVGSAGLLFLIIQTPGLSHFFGCRPLGPVGWATAMGASAAATGLSTVAWRAVESGGSDPLKALPQVGKAIDRWVSARELGRGESV
jgi:cation-transporting ATPase I